MNNEPQTQQADDPGGLGWRWVRQGETLELHDRMRADGEWWATKNAGETCSKEGMYRRRIEQQPSGGEPENAELQQLREQVRDLTRQAQFDAMELQQLKEQVQTQTRERHRYRNQLAGAIEHSKAPEAQAKLVDRLQKWLRPVLEVVADHPDHSSILAASVLEFLPQIASRLIEE